MLRSGPCCCDDHLGTRAAPPRLPRRYGHRRAARLAHRHRTDDRQRRVQSVRRGDRRAGLPGPRARRSSRGTPVGGRCPIARHRPAEVRLVHAAAVVASTGAGVDLRHHEPVALRGHRQDRAGPGGDPGVPGPAVGGAAGIPPRHGHRLRHDGRSRRRRPGQAAAEHRLRRHHPGLACRRLLGRVHPGKPGPGSPAARLPGTCGRSRPIGPALRSGRHLGPGQPPADRRRAGPRGHRRRLVLSCPDGR